jgi:hypothetical protein
MRDFVNGFELLLGLFACDLDRDIISFGFEERALRDLRRCFFRRGRFGRRYLLAQELLCDTAELKLLE